MFLHVMTNGDIWVSTEFNDTPAGTVAAAYRINGGSALTKLGTISGTNPYSASGSTGKSGKEQGGR